MIGLPSRFLAVLGWLLFQPPRPQPPASRPTTGISRPCRTGSALRSASSFLSARLARVTALPPIWPWARRRLRPAILRRAGAVSAEPTGMPVPTRNAPECTTSWAASMRRAGELPEAVQKYKTAKRLAPSQTQVVEQDMLDADRKLMRRGALSAGQITSALRGGLEDKALGVVPTIDLRVPFVFDSTALTGPGRSQVEHLRQAIAELDGHRFRLIGHTDSQGSATYNQALSERRAEAVRSYLIRHGAISSDAIRAEGRGEREPLYSGQTAEMHALNRRVEVQIEETGGAE